MPEHLIFKPPESSDVHAADRSEVTGSQPDVEILMETVTEGNEYRVHVKPADTSKPMVGISFAPMLKERRYKRCIADPSRLPQDSAYFAFD